MINKKGFTLVELLVAMFISGMVTVALVSVWRGASMQTSQAMRQSVIRNNFSIFLRGLHKDITEADLILHPSENNPSGFLSGGVFLLGAYNARRDLENVYAGRYGVGDNISTYFYYCLDTTTDANNHIIRRGPLGEERFVQDPLLNSDNTTIVTHRDKRNISNTIGGSDGVLPSSCAGTPVMDSVENVRIITGTPSDLCPAGSVDSCFEVAVEIYKGFGGNSVPVNLEFVGAFVAAGGK